MNEYFYNCVQTIEVVVSDLEDKWASTTRLQARLDSSASEEAPKSLTKQTKQTYTYSEWNVLPPNFKILKRGINQLRILLRKLETESRQLTQPHQTEL